jgi:hypothetical protein
MVCDNVAAASSLTINLSENGLEVSAYGSHRRVFLYNVPVNHHSLLSIDNGLVTIDALLFRMLN